MCHLLSPCSHQLKNFRNNNNRDIKDLINVFCSKIKEEIDAGTRAVLPEAPLTLKPIEFAPAYGFRDYVYSDKFERIIKTVTDATSDVVML